MAVKPKLLDMPPHTEECCDWQVTESMPLASASGLFGLCGTDIIVMINDRISWEWRYVLTNSITKSDGQDGKSSGTHSEGGHGHDTHGWCSKFIID